MGLFCLFVCLARALHITFYFIVFKRHIVSGCPTITYIKVNQLVQEYWHDPSNKVPLQLFVQTDCFSTHWWLMAASIISLGLVQLLFFYSFIVSMYNNWNSSLKNFLSSIIWLPWNTVYRGKAKKNVTLFPFPFLTNELVT